MAAAPSCRRSTRAPSAWARRSREHAQRARRGPGRRRRLLDGPRPRRGRRPAGPERDVDLVLIAARGTSDHAAVYAQYVLGARNRLPVALAAPSLSRVYGRRPGSRTRSSSGSPSRGARPTSSRCSRTARAQGALTVALTNDPASELAAAAEHVIELGAGPERAVAATKTYVAEVAAAGDALGGDLRRRRRPRRARAPAGPLRAALEAEAGVAAIAAGWAAEDRCAVLARGFQYATAREWALKLKELAYVLADPYSGADFQHGPIALVEAGFPVLAVATAGPLLADMHALLGRLGRGGARLLVLSDVRRSVRSATASRSRPACRSGWRPIVAIMPGPAVRLPPGPGPGAGHGGAARHLEGDADALTAPDPPRVYQRPRAAGPSALPGRAVCAQLSPGVRTHARRAACQGIRSEQRWTSRFARRWTPTGWRPGASATRRSRRWRTATASRTTSRSVEAAAEPIRWLINHPQVYGVVAEDDGRIVGSNFLDERVDDLGDRADQRRPGGAGPPRRPRAHGRDARAGRTSGRPRRPPGPDRLPQPLAEPVREARHGRPGDVRRDARGARSAGDARATTSARPRSTTRPPATPCACGSTATRGRARCARRSRPATRGSSSASGGSPATRRGSTTSPTRSPRPTTTCRRSSATRRTSGRPGFLVPARQRRPLPLVPRPRAARLLRHQHDDDRHLPGARGAYMPSVGATKGSRPLSPPHVLTSECRLISRACLKPGSRRMQAHAITMLGTGLIGDFYTMTLHGQRGRDRVRVVYSRSEERGEAFSERWDIPESTTDMEAAIRHPETDVVVVALPNHLHEEAVKAVAAAGKAVLCTKPLGRTADEAQADARGGRAGRRLRRLPRGPVLHAQDAQGDPVRPGRRARRRDLGPLPRDASGAAQRLVLGRPAHRRRRHHRPRLPLHRDHPQLHRQGEPAGRGDVPHGHAGPPDRGRGQRHRADPVRVRGDRPVRGELDVPRRHGPARRGGRHRRHDLAQPLPAHRLRDVHRRRQRRLRRREGRDRGRLAVPGRRRGRRARLRRHVHGHVRRDRRRRGAPARRSTTATSSTR